MHGGHFQPQIDDVELDQSEVNFYVGAVRLVARQRTAEWEIYVAHAQGGFASPFVVRLDQDGQWKTIDDGHVQGTYASWRDAIRRHIG